MTPAELPLTSNDPQPDLEQVVEDLLNRLPAGLARAIRLGAIPHRLTPELLSRLTGSPEKTNEYLSEMNRLGFLNEAADGWLVYPSQLRIHLLSRLYHQLRVYRPASARLARYFHNKMEEGENRAIERDRLEYLYHLFAADESAALVQLRQYFDNFQRTQQQGAAAQMIHWIAEQKPVLTPVAQNWLLYYQILLQPTNPDPEKIQETFQELIARTNDPLLIILAQRSLGKVLAQNRQWIASEKNLRMALQGFQKIGDNFETANTQAELSAIYVSLAESAGGLRDENPHFEARWKRWLYALQLLPFLIYRWCSRRLAWVPNLYFGSDYQNWIIIRYLYESIGWLIRADRSLGHNPKNDPPDRGLARIQIRIRLADLYQQVGRWSQADRLFADLNREPVVQVTPYLLALVQLGRGSLLLARGAFQAAFENLHACQSIFRQYGDQNSAGKAARLIAQVCARRGQIEDAVLNYREAAEAFQNTDDLLNATETLVRAQTLAERLPVRRQQQLQLEAFSEKFSRQAYMERFPDHSGGHLHRIFRGLAAYLGFPITWLQIIVISRLQMLWVAVVDLFFNAVISRAPQSTLLMDLAMALPFLLLASLLVFWTYEALYAIVGTLVARILPIRRFTHQQPVYFVMDQTALGRYDHHGKLTDFLPWAEATVAASLDRRIGLAPLTLFSRFFIGNGEKILIVDGILNHYMAFKREAKKRLQIYAQRLQSYPLDVTLLEGRWLGATLAMTLLMVAIAIFLKINLLYGNKFMIVKSPSGVIQTLYITDIVFQFWRWLALIGPLSALIQLLYKRWATRRLFGKKIPMDAEWPIWIALLILTLITLGELRMLFS